MGSTCCNLSKMAKNCMKITKSIFLGQNSGGGMGGQTNFLDGGEGGGVAPSPHRSLVSCFPDCWKVSSVIFVKSLKNL